MVGMLQIIIIMGCIYLIMKAIHIAQTGLLAPAAGKKNARGLTIAGCIIGVLGAALSFYLMMEQSNSISSPY